MPLQRRRRSPGYEYSHDYKRARLASPDCYAYSRAEHPAALSDMRMRYCPLFAQNLSNRALKLFTVAAETTFSGRLGVN